jgi:DNA-binding IclR family transcriptional regulator
VHLDKLDDGARVAGVSSRVGSRAPAHHAGLGLASLGLLTPEEAIEHLRHFGAADALAGELGLELHRIRRNGFVHRVGDYGPGLASVSAPIDGRAALGVVIAADVSPEPYKPLVRAAAAGVRRALSAVG